MLASKSDGLHPVALSSNQIPPKSPIVKTESIVTQTQSTISNEEDPLIDLQWERIDYIATFLIVILLIIGFGLLSRQVEYALIAAALITLLLIGIVLFV